MDAQRSYSKQEPESLPEQFYRALAETIPHMVWSARPDGYCDYSNRRLQEYAGLAPAELAGRGWQAIVHPEDKDGCRAGWQRALARGERFETEHRLRRRDGRYLWHLGTAEPLRAGVRIVRWFGTCTDFEGQKRVSRMLRQARSSLEALVEARIETLGAGQHNPLTLLSARERQVLRCTVEGMTIAETAAQLCVSPKSVETYRSRVMSKLGIVGLPGLVKFAIRNGVTKV